MRQKMKNKEIPLPFSKDKRRRSVQADIDADLFEAFEKEVKRNDAFKRDIIEWGVKMYILKSNEELATELGIVEVK